MKKNKILRKFVSEIDSSDKDYLDIRSIFTTRQKNVYTKLERTMDVLFSSKNIYDGLSEIIEQHELTQNEQVFVLMILKMYEVAFSAFDESNMNEVMEQMATMRPPPMGDSPEVA